MAVSDPHVFPGFLTPVLTQLSFESLRLLFSHASAKVRGKNTPERKFASTGSLTHNHQVMSRTCSPLSHPGGANFVCQWSKCYAIYFRDFKTLTLYINGVVNDMHINYREKETSILKEQIDKLNSQIRREERRAEDLKIKAK